MISTIGNACQEMAFACHVGACLGHVIKQRRLAAGSSRNAQEAMSCFLLFRGIKKGKVICAFEVLPDLADLPDLPDFSEEEAFSFTGGLFGVCEEKKASCSGWIGCW